MKLSPFVILALSGGFLAVTSLTLGQDSAPKTGKYDPLLPPVEPSAEEESKKEGPPQTKETLSDEQILEKMGDYDTAYLVDLWRIYLRLKNENMVTALQAEIDRRDPALSDTLKKEQANEVSGPYVPSPLEQMEDKIDKLMRARKNSEAIAYMESLKATKFKGKFFPFEKDLGDIYADSGQMEKARACYMVVVDNAKYPDGVRAEAKAGLDEIARQEAIKAGYALLEAREYKTALLQATELLGRYPADPETKVFRAQALTANCRYSEALPILEEMRDTGFKGRPFPGWDALAECLMAAGRLDEAKIAYEKVSVDPSEKPYDQAAARRQIREIERLHGNHIKAGVEFIDEAEGQGTFFAWEGVAQQSDQMEVGVRGWVHDASLTNERVVDVDDSSHWGAVGTLTYRWDNLFYGEAWAGGGNFDGPNWGVAYGKEQVHHSQIGFRTGVEFNAPAIDSLQLIALDGLEDRAFVEFVAPLAPKVQLQANASLRRITAQGVDLGDGLTAEVRVLREMYQNREGTVRFTAGFHGQYRQFNADTLSASSQRQLRFRGAREEGSHLGDTLVEPEYAPQGLVVMGEARLSDKVFVFAEAGVARDFADNEFSYHLSVGTEIELTPEWDLVIEGSYYSDGVTGVNADGSLWIATAGLRTYY